MRFLELSNTVSLICIYSSVYIHNVYSCMLLGHLPIIDSFLTNFGMMCKHGLVCQFEKRGGEYKESARGREDLQHTGRRPATRKQPFVLLLDLS